MSGILLAGVVFVNVAVLRLNLALDGANADRVKLRAENAALQSELSSKLRARRDPGAGLASSSASRTRIRPSTDTSTWREVKGERQANRRIRLLLAVFVLVFAGTLARAAWLQGVQAGVARADGPAPAP